MCLIYNRSWLWITLRQLIQELKAIKSVIYYNDEKLGILLWMQSSIEEIE